MKKILFAAMLVAGLFFSGCSDRLYDSNSKLSTEYFYIDVYPNNLSYPADGGTESISVNGDSNWQLGTVPSWISYTKTYNSAELTAEANPATVMRTGIVNVTTGNKDIRFTETVELTQESATPKAYFNEEKTYEISAEAQVLSVPYTSTVPIEDVSVTGAPTWADVVINTNTIDINIKANTSTSSRQSSFIYLNPYSYSSDQVKIKIIQLGANVGIEGDTYSKTVPWTGGNYTIKFKSNVPWTSYCNTTWLTVSPNKGDKSDGDVVISVSENLGSNRSGEVRFRLAGYTVATYSIIQESLSFSAIEPSSITLDQTGNDSKTVTFTTNMPWEIEYAPNWLSVTPYSGEAGKHTVTLKAASANGSTKPRTSYLRFRAQNNKFYYSDKITVTQEGVPNGVGTNDLFYGWPGGTQNVDIFTPGTWQCAVSDSWISVSQTSGLGDGSLGITVQPNSQATERSGSVLVQLIDETLTINVKQQGQYFYIDNSSSQLNAKGGNIELTVFTSVGASAQVEPQEATEWLTFTGPNDESTFVITAAYNPSINARNANFVLTPTMDEVKTEYTQGLVYNIIQAGRKLETSVPKLYLGKPGGVSEPCTIIAEGGRRIWKDDQDSWYILQANANNSSFTISATPNNTGANRTGMVHIELTGLPDGESKQVDVQIIQTTSMFDVELGEFGEDEQW